MPGAAAPVPGAPTPVPPRIPSPRVAPEATPREAPAGAEADEPSPSPSVSTSSAAPAPVLESTEAAPDQAGDVALAAAEPAVKAASCG